MDAYKTYLNKYDRIPQSVNHTTTRLTYLTLNPHLRASLLGFFDATSTGGDADEWGILTSVLSLCAVLLEKRFMCYSYTHGVFDVATPQLFEIHMETITLTWPGGLSPMSLVKPLGTHAYLWPPLTFSEHAAVSASSVKTLFLNVSTGYFTTTALRAAAESDTWSQLTVSRKPALSHKVNVRTTRLRDVLAATSAVLASDAQSEVVSDVSDFLAGAPLSTSGPHQPALPLPALLSSAPAVAAVTLQPLEQPLMTVQPLSSSHEIETSQADDPPSAGVFSSSVSATNTFANFLVTNQGRKLHKPTGLEMSPSTVLVKKVQAFARDDAGLELHVNPRGGHMQRNQYVPQYVRCFCCCLHMPCVSYFLAVDHVQVSLCRKQTQKKGGFCCFIVCRVCIWVAIIFGIDSLTRSDSASGTQPCALELKFTEAKDADNINRWYLSTCVPKHSGDCQAAKSVNTGPAKPVAAAPFQRGRHRLASQLDATDIEVAMPTRRKCHKTCAQTDQYDDENLDNGNADDDN